MIVNLITFIEGKKYRSDEFVDIPEHIITDEYFKISKKRYEVTYTPNVTGIYADHNFTFLFLPKNTTDNLTKKEKQEFGQTLFRAMLKYKNNSVLEDEEMDWLGSENSNIELLDTVDWLLIDFLDKGLLSFQNEREVTNGTGRILWNKTIQKYSPVVIDENLIYENVISKQYNTDENNILRRIHQFVISDCLENYGWLYNLSIDLGGQNFNLGLEEKINFLKRSLEITSESRSIILIKNMIIYLERKKGKVANLILLTKYFNYIWEKALSISVNHNTKLLEMLPKPYWFINGEKVTTNQKPDILIEKENDLLIIDAKHYSINSEDTTTLPGWPSIVKQLYYRTSINDDYENVYNIFMIPKYMEPQNIEYIGYSSVDKKEDVYSMIQAYFINTKMILISFIDDVQNNYINEIYQDIKTR